MHNMTVAEMSVVAWCISIGLADLYARRLPNPLTLGGCLIAISWLLVTGHSILDASLQSAVLGAAVSLLLTLPAYAARLLGAGDVKLLTAIALLGGAYVTLFSFVIAAILAVIFSMAHILFIRLTARPMPPKRWVPLGAAMSAGLLCAMGMTK